MPSQKNYKKVAPTTLIFFAPEPSGVFFNASWDLASDVSTIYHRIGILAIGSHAFHLLIELHAIGFHVFYRRIDPQAIGSYASHRFIELQAIGTHAFHPLIELQAIGAQAFHRRVRIALFPKATQSIIAL